MREFFRKGSEAGVSVLSVRNNFSKPQRESALRENARWLQTHRVDGVSIAMCFEDLHRTGAIYYCENCLFCHSDTVYFDVDHFVPDRIFRDWGKHSQSTAAVNIMVLCKSLQKGDLGCNQSKGGKLTVPARRGLAFTLRELDMNCEPLKDRPFVWT